LQFQQKMLGVAGYTLEHRFGFLQHDNISSTFLPAAFLHRDCDYSIMAHLEAEKQQDL
jgi:hypothetical protein